MGITKVQKLGINTAVTEYIPYHDDYLCRLDNLKKEMSVIWNSYGEIEVVYPIAVMHARRISGIVKSKYPEHRRKLIKSLYEINKNVLAAK